MATPFHKFAFAGEILKLRTMDILQVATIAVGTEIVEVTLTNDEAARLAPGDKVLVASKAFNPVIQKIETQSLL